MAIDNDTRIAIGEMIRESKNNSDNMLFDLMLYGHLTDENGNKMGSSDIRQVQKENETILSSTIDLTGDKAKIYHKVKNNDTGETETKQVNVYYCDRDDCRHNVTGICMSDPINKLSKVCSRKDNWQYFEGRE